MAIKRVNVEVLRTLRPVQYATADGIEAKNGHWVVEAVGPRDALAALVNESS